MFFICCENKLWPAAGQKKGKSKSPKLSLKRTQNEKNKWRTKRNKERMKKEQRKKICEIGK